jgi:hypothetical protein
MSSYRRFAISLAAAGAALGATLGAAAPALASPRTGDWEATSSHGAVGSFAVATVERRSHGRTERVSEIRDLVVQAPISCLNPFSTPLPIDVEVLSGTARLGRNGRFTIGAVSRRHGGTIASGSYRRGKFAITYHHVTDTYNQYEQGAEVCRTGTVHLTARPGHRRFLKAGIWEGQTALQEPVEMNVVAGGRALVSPTDLGPGGIKYYAFEIAADSSSDACAYKISYPVFLNPDDTFSNSVTRLGDEAVVSGTFTGDASIGGEFSNAEESCPQENWTANWYLTSPAGK